MEEIKTKRCAIYTRKSVEDGLEQEFNSLDAQREAGEAYIASQKSNGWVCLPEHYDDGGWSGGNVNRPGLKKLLADAEAGLIDIVVVYKIDRLSRSICDFAELSRKFDQWNVAFVAVTQEINTATSAGRMMLNILITFAQYEREVITERVRDKMAASRKKGKWVGGNVALGYKVVDKKLIVEPTEAELVRQIFKRFLEIQSPKTIAYELNRKQLWTKQGKPWTKQKIYGVLNNHHYIGEILYKGEIFQGEQEALVDRETWELCHRFMKANDQVKGERNNSSRMEFAAPLRGILRCGHCNGAMTPVRAKRNGRIHHYYQCSKDLKRPESICPVKSVSASEIEKIVHEQMKTILVAPEIVLEVAKQTGEKPRDIIEMFSEKFWDEVTPGERQRLMQLLLERVTINENDIRLEVRTNGVRSIMELHNAE